MAYTIMGGLSVATLLTLFVPPAIYALRFRKSLGAATKHEVKSVSRADGVPLGLPTPAE